MPEATRPPPRSSRLRYRAWIRRAPGRDPEAPGAGGTPARRETSFLALLAAFWGLLRGHRGTIGLSLVTLSVATGLGLIPPYATKLVFDHVLPAAGGTPIPPPAWVLAILPEAWHAPEPLLLAIGGAVMAVTSLSIGVGMWGRWQCTRIVKRVQVGLRRRVFEHAGRLPLERIQEMRSGGTASLLREDAGGAGDLIFSLVYNPWRAITQLAGTLTILALIDWRMLAGAAALLPVIWLTHRTWIARIRPMFRDIRTTRQTLDAQAAESFAGIRIVRGFGREHAEAARYTRGGHLMARQEIRTWWWSRAIDIAWSALVPGASVAVLIIFGRGVLAGERTTGELIAFMLYLGWLLGPLEVIVASANVVQNQIAGLDRVLDTLDEPAEFASSSPRIAVSRDAARGRITLEHVGFAYPPRRERPSRRARPTPADAPPPEPRPVLRDISLDVAPGETIALVGPSGSGKTTLCNLIARFHDPTSGRVMLDGVDLRDITPRSYRSLLGVVEQDVFLFDGSVGENIAYGRRRATAGQVRAAAEAAAAHAFIADLEHGYDTVIGERGVRLSGGQKQRIAIARALLADPLILILDEATSNLDSESERLIQAALADLMRGRTSFVIAHRLSTIRHADRIVVLERGEIREVGSHRQLMERDDRYAELVRLQTEADRDDA